MKKAIGYIRVSTEGQEDKFGIEAQKEMIEGYAKSNGFEIERYLTDVVSGVKDKRPQWDLILEEAVITNPPYEAIIVAKSDRVARDTKLYFYYLYLLEKRNIQLVSVQEDFDAMGEFANVIRSMMLFVAEQERKNITARTSAGRNSKAKIGGYSGGRPPYGYSVDKNTKTLVVNEGEAVAVRKIFEWREEGVSKIGIAIRLAREGFKTKNGGRWSNTHIIHILRNEQFYRGFYRYGDQTEWVKGKHEAILK